MTRLAQGLNVELARRIELAEARAAVAAAEALARLRPEAGVAVEEIGGGFAVFCGAGSPVTQAVGVGLNGDVDEAEFDRLERFYCWRNEPVRVETCPLADASLIAHFGERQYRVTEFTNVMARSLPADDPSELQSTTTVREAITVERVPDEQIDLWTRIVSEGFSEHLPVTPELLEVMRAFASAENVECYLARAGSEIAGGGTLILRDGVAGLFGASTLPAFRNQGVQTALLDTRLARASEAGCDLAVCLAKPGSASQRNVVRRGFEVLYTRVKFEKHS
jgi:GNAT superfamily N-acetyltransferase